jgi:hypothetical protein
MRHPFVLESCLVFVRIGRFLQIWFYNVCFLRFFKWLDQMHFYFVQSIFGVPNTFSHNGVCVLILYTETFVRVKNYNMTFICNHPYWQKKFQTTRNHGFSKGSIWLNYSHWPKGCSLWLKAWGMKDTWFFWLVLKIEVTILTKC